VTASTELPPRGLPEHLPAGERVVWQGAPHWPSLARRALHLRLVAAYFAVILMVRAAFVLAAGGSVAAAAVAILWLLPFALAVIGVFALLAWLIGRTTVYTITDRRVIMRVGVVLSITFNLPYRAIESASLHVHSDGCGDIALALAGDTRIAWIHLWPHVRPWRIAHTQPMLRSVPQAVGVAALLARALATTADGVTRAPVRAPAPAAQVTLEPRPLAQAH
jgi:hypothetical protein